MIRVRAARRTGEGRLPVRAPFLVAGGAALLVFGADTLAATASPYLGWDVPATRAVQAVDWGPLALAFQAVDWVEGLRQVAVSATLLLLVLVLNRPAALLAVACALSGAAYSLTEVLVRRPRPPAGLVHVIRHTNGYSYPSGHEVFFTWFTVVLVLALVRPYLPRPVEIAGWLLVPAVLLLVGLGRVDVGEHWPSDVLGGLALGVAWTSLALSVGRLSAPVLDRPAHG
jgi:membrane-associated phospholipid phosphatase